MERKKLNTVLILIVALIWGVVLYKFLAPYLRSPGPVITASTLIRKPSLVIKKKDTAELVFPSRDPFLGKIAQQKKTTRAVRPTKSNRKDTRSTEPVNWPDIEYLGFVKSKNSDNRLGLIRIAGVLHRVNENSTVKGLKIGKINPDEIQIVNGKETRYFKKL